MSLKVLLCDTDWRFVDRATQYLSAHGHQVLAEAIPSEAMELSKRWKPDVVVLASESTEGHNDKILKQLKHLPNPPAILLTGQLDHFDAAWRAWRKGGDEVLLKPVINAAELHTAIIAAMRGKTGAASEAASA
jgi:DNA-binding response OmpR family regulator